MPTQRNLAASRGDVIKLDRRRAVISQVAWNGTGWEYHCLWLLDRGTRLGAETYTTAVPGHPLPSEGSWVGDLVEGAAGNFTTPNNSPQGQEAATMATVVKRSTKSGSKASTTTKTTAAKPAATSAKRSQADVDKLVPKFRQHLTGGGTMRDLKKAHGFSDDGPIRAALYRAGFDSKGAEHGEVANSIDATKKPGKDKVLALRSNEGAGWYRLAFLTGLSESEVKKLVADAGGPVGRVYIAAEKPAKEPKAAKEPAAEEATAATARKGSGKKVTRRATKADPSK